MFFNLFSKFIITFNLTLFSLMSMFLNDLFIIWFFMEINNFMFISLMCLKIFNKKIIFFYFIIQTLASLIIIFSIIYSSIFFLQFNIFSFMFILGLTLKLGIPPFHLWMISISMYLDWNTLFIFLSIQKIIPMYMMSLLEMNTLILYLLILSSSYVSVKKMMMNLNFKVILTLSSINQTSWMLMLIMFKNILWFLYFMIYTIILLMITLMFQFLKMSNNFLYNTQSLNFKFIYLFLFLNLASLPPLSFFFMKWLSVYTFLFNSSNLFLILIMLFNSFILIYVYINMMIMLMFFYSSKSKMLPMINYNPFKNIYLIMFFSLFFSLSLILI